LEVSWKYGFELPESCYIISWLCETAITMDARLKISTEVSPPVGGFQAGSLGILHRPKDEDRTAHDVKVWDSVMRPAHTPKTEHVSFKP
jgi:hypothetical protein